MLLNFYRKAIAYRKGKDVIIKGDFSLVRPKDKDVFAYIRESEGKRLLVIANYKNKRVKFRLPDEIKFAKVAVALSNYADVPADPRDITLREYEAVVYELYD